MFLHVEVGSVLVHDEPREIGVENVAVHHHLGKCVANLDTAQVLVERAVPIPAALRMDSVDNPSVIVEHPKTVGSNVLHCLVAMIMN